MQHVTVSDESSNEPGIIIPGMGMVLQASMLAGFTGSEAIVQRANNNLIELGKRLLTSAELGDTDEVRLLMSRGAPFATDWLGTSPLHAAAANGHLETCELLLRAGISRDARTKVDRTPLHVAAQEGHADIVELLLDAGADVDAKDMLRMTPLHWAVEREHVDCVRLLLRHSANPHHVSKFDKTAFSMALEANHHDILELLETSVTAAAAASASATLEATESLALVLGQVPVPAHQEEVQTSAQKVHAEEAKPPKVFLQEPVKVTEHVTTEDKLPEVKMEETVVDSGSQSTLRLLQAHGIHMLPTEEQSLVASALQSGHTVVLTEAGKLALNLTGAVQTDGTAGPAGVPPGRKKVITIRATPSSPLHQRLFRGSVEKRAQPEAQAQPRAPVAFLPRRGRPPGSAVTTVGYAPNILKRAAAPIVVSSVASTVGVAVVSPTVVTASSSSPPATKVLVRSPPTTKVVVNGSGGDAQLTDLATITRQLEEARREAEAYKLLLSKKEREAELYRQQLQSITQQSQ